MRFARAILFVADLERMTSFYRDVLGLAHFPERSEQGWVELDGVALHALPHERAPDPPVRRANSWIKLVFATDDVDGTRARLVAQGVPMDEPVRWGVVAICDGLDPEGNVFQISSRP